MPTIHQIIIVSTITAFIILFLNKTGYRDRIRNFCDMKNKRLIAEMLDCDFCLSFWTSVLITLIFILLGFNYSLLVPICSTPIIRYIL